MQKENQQSVMNACWKNNMVFSVLQRILFLLHIYGYYIAKMQAYMLLK